eukprot:1714157-Amphidinium_carterae.2
MFSPMFPCRAVVLPCKAGSTLWQSFPVVAWRKRQLLEVTPEDIAQALAVVRVPSDALRDEAELERPSKAKGCTLLGLSCAEVEIMADLSVRLVGGEQACDMRQSICLASG